MLRILRKYIVGGRTDKRESAWLVFIAWAIAFVWAAHKEAAGFSVAGTQAILSAAMIPVIALVAVAHGMEWVSEQTSWGKKQDDGGGFGMGMEAGD